MLEPLTGASAGPSRTLTKVWVCSYGVGMCFCVVKQVKPDKSVATLQNVLFKLGIHPPTFAVNGSCPLHVKTVG